MVVVKFVTVCNDCESIISEYVPEKSLAVEDCHLIIVPVLPLNLNSVEFVPEHAVVLPVIEPPTDTGETVTVQVPVETVGVVLQAPSLA